MARPKKFDPEQVVDAAMTAFWTKGYAATSAEDLVERTGLGRGSLYHAFTNKRHLFQETLRRYETHWTARRVEILEGPGSVRERIRALLMSVVEEETAARPTHRGCLAVNAAIELAGRDPDATDQVRRVFQRVEDALWAAIQRGQRDGEIAADRDARALAQFTLNSMYGLRVLGKTADRQTLTGIVDSVLRAL
jgi:TetR/AcrR family transcriptional repressor of nem operon